MSSHFAAVRVHCGMTKALDYLTDVLNILWWENVAILF